MPGSPARSEFILKITPLGWGQSELGVKGNEEKGHETSKVRLVDFWPVLLRAQRLWVLGRELGLV